MTQKHLEAECRVLRSALLTLLRHTERSVSTRTCPLSMLRAMCAARSALRTSSLSAAKVSGETTKAKKRV